MRQIRLRAWDEQKEIMMMNTHVIHDGYIVMMQYTGLNDKNNKPIFEGDICKVHIFTQELGENLGVTEGEKEFIAEIKISDKGEGVILDNGKEEDSGPIWSYGGMHEESFEVIGNVHEHPELLKLENASE